jgi:hypothetical protein
MSLIASKIKNDLSPALMSNTQSLIPPTRSKSEVLTAFKKVGIYSEKFLTSLTKGLERSSFFTEE